jgi:DNA-binding SARP family transcriptional activator
MLRVCLLGEEAITDEATGAVRSRSWRTLALVAFLVVHAGTPQSRQHIAGLFWPDSSEQQALTNLRRELHHLRDVLRDEPSLEVTGKNLCWRDTATCRVDVRCFAADRAAAVGAAADDDVAVLRYATSALDHYRGEFLPGRFDDWVLDARSELERQCVELCDLLIGKRAANADLAGALDVARRRVALRPLEEVGYRNLMELQADLGDRAGAVSTYHHCAAVLERELGVDPDPATRRTVQQLVARERPDGDAGLSMTDPPIRRPGYVRAALVGRAREVELLHALWRTVDEGPRLALVRGHAGVGKTRLVTEVADELARAGAVVATARCFGTAGSLALAPVADWLRHPVVQSAAARLDPVWRAEVDRLVPSDLEQGAPGPGAPSLVHAWQRHRFFEGLTRALTGVGRPTLLVLDNVQWCDEETLAFITFALGLATGSDASLMVAATLRDDEPDPGDVVENWVARMRASGSLTEVALRPLEALETARLAEAISGRTLGDDETAVLHATTGGYPLYIVEAARSTVDRGGARLPVGELAAVLPGRLEQVGATVREVAGLAAAAGRNVTLDLLTDASDLGAGTVVQAVDELWRRRILRESGDGYEFSHDLLREAAYAQVTPARRWLLHRRVAQALELLHAGDTDPVCAQLAEQYVRAGRAERALAYYRRAADIAAGRFAHAEAIRLHSAALGAIRALPAGRSRDSHELAVLEAMAAPLNANLGYASPKLERTAKRSLVLAESLGRQDSTLTALIALWSSLQVQGRIAEGYEVATRALAMVEPGSDLSGQAHFAVAGAAFSRGRLVEATHHFERVVDLGGSAGSLSVGLQLAPHARAWAAHAQFLLGHDDEALASCSDAVRVAREIDHPYSLAAALAYAAITHQMRHDVAAVAEAIAEANDLCQRYGFAYYREWVLILDGWSRSDRSGSALAERGIENLRSEGSLNRMPYWLSLLADLLVRHGAPGAARNALDAALPAGRAREDLWWIPEVMRMRAALEGPEAAVPRLRSAARMATVQGNVALLNRCERDLHSLGVR